jgi:post-segregation antitoxin (ccd killing protein)
MAEMGEKKGKMKVTVEVEINEELVELAKEATAQMSQHMPEMLRRGNTTQQ